MKHLFTTILAIFLTCNMMATNIWDGTAEPWTHGTGVSSDPYLIETAANLAYLAQMVNQGYQAQGMEVYAHTYFLMTDDFDLNNINWTPIGNVSYANSNLSGYYFAGVFDGWYHTISNLKIQTNASITGLFAGLGGTQSPPPGDGGGQVRHLSVVNGNITSTGFGAGGIVGALAGDAMVFQCSYSGTIQVSNGESFCGAGGIVAAAINGGITECSFSGSVSASNSAFTGAAGAGGIVGIAMESTAIGGCYNTGTVTGSALIISVAAGIVGATLQENDVSVYSCYNIGTVSAGTKGGIFGMVSPINPTKGETSINVTNCFYLNTCGGTTNYGTSMTSDEMKTEQFKNQIDMSAHAFVMDNGTNNGYPIHSLAEYRLLEASDVTCYSAKLSADIHQGNDDVARAYFLYNVWDATEMIEVEVPVDGHVEALLEDLTPETTYVFWFEMQFADGIIMAGGPHYFVTESNVGVESEEAISLMVYPNPATDIVHIQGVDAAEVQIFNAFGQLVKTVKVTNEINVSDLANGTYLLRVDDVFIKIVVVR
jgi:hypothetical protein